MREIDTIEEVLSERLKYLSDATGWPVLVPDYPLSLRIRGHITLSASGEIIHVGRSLQETVQWLKDQRHPHAIIANADGDKVSALLRVDEQESWLDALHESPNSDK